MMMDEDLHHQAIKAIRELTGYVDDERVGGRRVVAANLDRSLASDDVLAPLLNLKRLHYLGLAQTRVTDKVMEVLRVHPEIKRLNISDTAITDRGLKFLKYAESLEELYVGSKITDAGLQHLRGLKKLRVLALEDTQVTHAGLRRITSLAKLECLFLSGRQISGASIRSLKKLPRLKTITLLLESSDDSAAQELKQALPKVRVGW
jgi:internalin A